MAWTEITRPQYQRDGLRYASDTTDEEWVLIEPHLPAAAGRGRTRETEMREGLSRHWGVMLLWQRPGLHSRSDQIAAPIPPQAYRCRLRNGPGAADRRHFSTIASAGQLVAGF
jgi:hypothetical protein